MQNTSLPRSTSRQSLASNNGLRARDLHRLQAQLDEHEHDIQRHKEQERSSHERSYASKRRTSVTSANASHYSYTSRPSLQPADRQHSSGYLRERQERPAPASRSRRTASNASKSSTILSAGLRDHSWQDGAATRDAHPAIKLRASSSYIKLDDLQTHSSPLRRWCRLVEKSCRGSGTPQSAKEWVVAVACIVWIKWAVGIGGWSGKGYPPLYGDLEAQRNWLSITNHLPISRWYWHRPEFWGLDYPPLTAYHSFLLGWIARTFGNPRWAELDGRLGGREAVFREEKAILFMRATVIAGDILLWLLPVAFWCALKLGRWNAGTLAPASTSKRSARTLMLAFYSVMLQPSLIMIDSGHFQYNSIMLGLTLMSMLAFDAGRDYVGAALFVCSMCFKQMALYYAPAIFAYLLGKCFWLGGADGLNLFVNIGFFSTVTLLLCFAPFLTSITQVQHVLARIFPFGRGLFEDKVANVWCSLNVVIKLRQIFSSSILARLAAVATLAATMPLVAGFVWTNIQLQPTVSGLTGETARKPLSTRRPAPTAKLLPHALFASAMAFFLFSFQVHEKSILLPLMPLTLLLVGKQPGLPGQDFEWAMLLNNVGTFSLYPLLKRDGLAIPTIALTFFWNYSIGYNPFKLPFSLVQCLTLASVCFGSSLLFLDSIITPPSHLPDLFTVLNHVWSCAIFICGWLWSLTRLVEEAWGLIGLDFSDRSPSAAVSTGSYRSASFSPAVSERSFRNRSPNLPSLEDLDNNRSFRQASIPRSASVASSVKSAVRRPRPPMASPAELDEDRYQDLAGPRSASSAIPITRRQQQHQRSSSQALSENNSRFLKPTNRPGNVSTQVSPSKTHVPSGTAGHEDRERSNDVFRGMAELDRWKQATMQGMK